MLVLTRRRDERIMIGDDIVITVVEVRANGFVRLGIDAPRDVPVHREEVVEAIKAESRRAAARMAAKTCNGPTACAVPNVVPG